MEADSKILIIGAGLCGSLLAIKLGQKGFDVTLIERRKDLRTTRDDSGRSINLALSDRGLKALRMVGLEKKVREICIPMNGRMIHSKHGETWFSSYSGRTTDYINSVSRNDLNRILIEEADIHQNVKILFEHKCIDVDIENSTAKFITNGQEYNFSGDLIIGTDGAGSMVRKEIFDKRSDEELSVEFLDHGYKELEIPADENGGYKLEKNALHIWPRGSYMIIALPNMDGSFTVTMFNAHKGDKSFEQIDQKGGFELYIKTEFPDLIPHLNDLLRSYDENPVGKLGTVRCYPWQDDGKTLIMGDAAHAIVPFYGQGMNAAFEDVTVFSEVLDEKHSSWEDVFLAFQERRHPSALAIADLAIDNFYEMRDHVADEAFIKKRKLEMQLEQEFPDYYSKYSLVTFKEDLPYEDAKALGRKQDAFLLDLCRSEEVDLKDTHKIFAQLKNLKQHGF